MSAISYLKDTLPADLRWVAKELSLDHNYKETELGSLLESLRIIADKIEKVCNRQKSPQEIIAYYKQLLKCVANDVCSSSEALLVGLTANKSSPPYLWFTLYQISDNGLTCIGSASRPISTWPEHPMNLAIEVYNSFSDKQGES